MQKWLIERFDAPVHKYLVWRWLETDPQIAQAAAKPGINPYRCRWHTQSWPYIEPLKDAQADLLRMRNGLISPRRLHAERGRIWEDLVPEIIADNRMAIEQAKTAAIEINQQFDDGEPVSWRELIALPTPDGVSLSVQPGGGTDGGASDAGN